MSLLSADVGTFGIVVKGTGVGRPNRMSALALDRRISRTKPTRVRGITLAAILVMCGCGTAPTTEPPSTSGREPFSLVDPSAWVQTTEAEDPFDDRIPMVDCGPGGHIVEGGAFEVNTVICNYTSVRQETTEPVRQGDEINIVVWHLVLIGNPPDAPAEAHMAVRIGEVTPWEVSVAIPSSEAVYETTWVADRDLPVGTPVYFHLHNHGYNTYKLGRMRVRPGS